MSIPSLDQLAQYILSGLANGCVYALVALGFATIYNVTGIINFAQGEFVMLGGMTAYWLLRVVRLPLPLAFIVTVVLVAAVGMALERLAIHPARNTTVVALITTTIGASIALRSVAGILWGRDALPLPHFSGETPIQVAGASVLPQHVWVVGVSLAVMLGLHLFTTHTLLGKALRACSVNRYAANLVGINTSTMSLVSFGVSAALGAVGGIIIAPLTMTSYDLGVMLGVKGFTAAVLGGLGSALGALVGGLVLGLLESLTVGTLSSALKDAISVAVLFVVLLLKPSGLFGGGGKG